MPTRSCVRPRSRHIVGSAKPSFAYSTLMMLMTGDMLKRPLPSAFTERSPSKSRRIFVYRLLSQQNERREAAKAALPRHPVQ